MTQSDTQCGQLFAWGASHTGQLGLGVGDDVATPTPVPGLSDIVAVTAAGAAGYAVDVAEGLWAWGWDMYGVLGIGSAPKPEAPIAPTVLREMGIPAELKETAGVARPTQVEGLPPIAQAVCSSDNVYALARDGTVWAWGNSMGLGRVARNQSDRPQRIETLDNIAALSADNEGDACYALDNDGTVWVWGNGYEGELGHGQPRFEPTPQRIPTLEAVRSVAAVPLGALALLDDGTVWGWGSGADQFGLTPRRGRHINEPLRISHLEGVAELVVGGGVAIARDVTGRSCAWGSRYYEFRGRERKDARSPKPAPDLDGWRCISIGPDHGLAVDGDGNLLSFGSDECGALGNGAPQAEWGPTVVTGLTGVMATAVAGSQSLAVCRVEKT